jgi:hypothetical protein
LPAGSGVFSKSRFRQYFSSAAVPPDGEAPPELRAPVRVLLGLIAAS